MSARVAAIDCGTNSIRLLVADIDEAGRLVDVVRTMTIVRLGQGVDATGRFAKAAIDRTFAACDDYAAAIRSTGASRLRFVATSAARDAANREEFEQGVASRLGIRPEIISGDEEARLSFDGATRSLDVDGDCLVFDIGGGSTEFVLGADEPRAAVSVDIGCVRLTERALHTDPPTTDEIAAALADIDAVLDDAQRVVPLDTGARLIGLAGSVTTVAALALNLTEYDSAAIHGARISAADVTRVTSDLLAATRADRAARSVMHPGRVDVIGAGALVLRRIMERCDAPEVTASEHDILDGIARSIISR